MDTRVVLDMLMSVIVPKLECAGEVRERNTKLVKGFEIVPIAAAEKLIGC